jgi:hypothetical protein
MDGHWVYGDLENSPIGKFYRIHEYKDNGYYKGEVDVDPATVGEFTGLQDANGTDVYEGDILHYPRNNKTYQVVFKDGIFWGEGENGCGCAAHFFPSCVIIGNVFDNHDLIEKGGNNE